MRALAEAIFAVRADGAKAANSRSRSTRTRSTTPGWTRWRQSGMNRASIGVQDFDPEIQKTIGREQSYELTRDVADKIRDRGVRSLNADILYGLPHQTRPASPIRCRSC
jgi:oxygen-independent coproporphyrinogen-3 oxidase